MAETNIDVRKAVSEAAIEMGKAEVSADVSNRYFHQRQAELWMQFAGLHIAQEQSKALHVQGAALFRLAKALEMLQNSIRQKKMS